MNSQRCGSFVLLVCLGLVAGCATAPKVATEFKPGADFSKWRTFDILPVTSPASAADPGLVLRVGEPARQAAAESLAAKGFQRVQSDQADFVVNLRGQSLPKVEVTDWGYTRTSYRFYGQIPVHVGQVDVRSYEERTLAVEIYDTRAKDMAWVGWMKRQSTGRVEANKVVQAVRQILAEFPPGQGLAQRPK